MFKRLSCLLLALTVLLGCGIQARAEEAPEANQFPIYVNGQSVSDAYSVLDNGVTYVSAYHVAKALIPDTTMWWATNFDLSGTGYTLTVPAGAPYIICNGRYLYAPDQVRVHPQTGDLLLPVRLLARALGAQLYWDPTGVFLTSGTPLESGDTFYNADELYLLARTIRHEGGNQPLEGQIAVANTLYNRVYSNKYPNTLHDVIYQPGQFSSSEGRTPEERHYIAAKLAMDGARTVPGNCYYFNTAGQSCWASRNKTHICTIGSQAFYG